MYIKWHLFEEGNRSVLICICKTDSVNWALQGLGHMMCQVSGAASDSSTMFDALDLDTHLSDVR